MPFNGSGTFVRTQNWTNDATNNLPISATKFDNEDNDFASGLSLCLTRDGQGGPSVPLTWTQALTINLAADGTAFSVNRTAGVNNPGLQLQLNDAASSSTINQPLATGLLNLAVAGAAVLSLIAAQAQAFAGTAAKPTYSFASDGGSGMYRVGAGDIGFAISGVEVLDLQATTITAFNTAVAGTPVFGVTNTSTVATQDARLNVTGGSSVLSLYAANQNRATAVLTNGPTTAQAALFTTSAIPLLFGANGILALTIDASGRFTFAAPQAGGQTNFTFNGRNGNNTASFVQAAGSGTAFGVVIQAGTTSADYALLVQLQGGGNAMFEVLGTGEVFVAEPSTSSAVPTGTHQVGYLDAPANVQNGNYTLALTDRGKTLVRSGATGPFTWTIPLNATIAFPVGTIINLAALPGISGVQNVGITGGVTLTWYPSNTTGARVLATTSAFATLYKVGTDSWIITGNGIS